MVITDVLQAADRGDVTLVCMLDLSTAYDIVDHDILLECHQRSHGVDGKAPLCTEWRYTVSQHSDNSRLSVSPTASCWDPSSSTSIVHHGIMLGPILFHFYCPARYDVLHPFALSKLHRKPNRNELITVHVPMCLHLLLLGCSSASHAEQDSAKHLRT